MQAFSDSFLHKEISYLVHLSFFRQIIFRFSNGISILSFLVKPWLSYKILNLGSWWWNRGVMAIFTIIFQYVFAGDCIGWYWYGMALSLPAFLFLAASLRPPTEQSKQEIRFERQESRRKIWTHDCNIKSRLFFFWKKIFVFKFWI